MSVGNSQNVGDVDESKMANNKQRVGNKNPYDELKDDSHIPKVGSPELIMTKRSLALEVQGNNELTKTNEKLTCEKQDMQVEMDIMEQQIQSQGIELDDVWRMCSQYKADAIYWKAKFDLLSANESSNHSFKAPEVNNKRQNTFFDSMGITKEDLMIYLKSLPAKDLNLT